MPSIVRAEHTVRIRADAGSLRIQPSLRDLHNRQFEPGSELPGYSRISLREAGDRRFMDSLHSSFRTLSAHESIGVGMAQLTPPLPPNRTGGFPASGSPVSGVSMRLTISAKAVFQTKQPSRRKPSNRTAVGSISSSRVSMRWVHTECSNHHHRSRMSAACLG